MPLTAAVWGTVVCTKIFAALEMWTHRMSHWGMDQQRTIPPGLPGRFFPHAVEDEQTRLLIAQRALSGESISDLAAEYNVSARTVMRYRDALEGGEN